MSTRVDVDATRLLSAWTRIGHQELWVLFRPSDTADVASLVRDAALEANDVIERAGQGDNAFSGPLSSSAAGHVVYLSRAFTPTAYRIHGPDRRSHQGPCAMMGR